MLGVMLLGMNEGFKVGVEVGMVVEGEAVDIEGVQVGILVIYNPGYESK